MNLHLFLLCSVLMLLITVPLQCPLPYIQASYFPQNILSIHHTISLPARFGVCDFRPWDWVNAFSDTKSSLSCFSFLNQLLFAIISSYRHIYRILFCGLFSANVQNGAFSGVFYDFLLYSTLSVFFFSKIVLFSCMLHFCRVLYLLRSMSFLS